MPHYYDSDPIVKSDIHEFTYHFHNEQFLFRTDNGVFSKETLDYASYLLILEVLERDLGKSVLDLGSGWGPIGIILKKLRPELEIDLVDVNSRAIELSKINAKANDVEVKVYQSDDISKLNKHYDTVILNPPIRAGKTVIYELYEKSREVLNNGGSLYIVIKKKHGAKSHFERLKETYADVKLINKVDGNWLIEAKH